MPRTPGTPRGGRGRPRGFIPDGPEIYRLRVHVHALTADELAAMVRYSASSVRAAERSESIGDVLASRLAKALGVRIEDIGRPREPRAALDELKPPPLYTTGAERGLHAHSNKTTEGTTRK